MKKENDPRKFDVDPLPPMDEFQWVPENSRKPPPSNDFLILGIIVMLAGSLIWWILLHPLYSYMQGD